MSRFPRRFAPASAQLTAALLLSLLPATTLSAQQAAPPVFRVNTRIVVLDVVVTDKKGNVVTNLTKDDFTIVEDNQRQTIRTFEPPSAHVMPPSPDGKAIVTSAADLPKIGDAPVTLLVLDELNTAFSDMAYARQSLEKYLKQQPEVLKQPTALLVANNTKFQLIHDYTQNRADVLLALKKHFPEYPWKMATSGKSGPGAAERIAQSLSSVIQIAEATSGTPGRKNVIWVGVNAPGVNLIDADPVTIKVMGDLTKRVTQTLLADRVTMYYINPTINEASSIAIMTPGDDDSGDADTFVDNDPFSSDVDFNSFAPATGGQVFASRNDVDNEIATSIDNGATYYTLSYSPSNKNEDALKYRGIHIKLLNRPDLLATTREGYYPETANANNSANDTTLSADQRKKFLQLDLSQAALSAMSYNGLTVTTQPGPDRQTWKVSVVANGLAWTPQRDGSLTAEVTAMSVALDAKNKPIGHQARELTSVRKADEASPDRINFTVPATIPAATKRLRFILRDAISGKIGTVDVTP